ncbi:MAG: bifunctional 23S rRNA (guanine(2069)-N(7))-methyltransferase RlmK/23S rRNA (guanine(2445)-N(2))-methyltransferase RlmL [Spirochaetes bacterium]|jgi:23S rRNA (guanine2445-N2)-methyltransferase / 23S rRNA (guanine2069-N7)-methyltransferase|nr:bifunctional 23S rRNA (guanine(2069)-N(7))-methyltransferase RlmK/23S rRNA (guanine(2445)-N(2))-methyltransferase RlmL [Spirochaetota bacterium]
MDQHGAPPVSRFFVSCPGHVEQLLAEEIRSILGVSAPGGDTDSGTSPRESSGAGVRESSGGVYLEGSLEDAYRVCLWSSIAGRVLGELATDIATDRDALYRAAAAVPFEEYFDVDRTFAVFGHSAHREFRDSRLAFLVVKDAIADRFRERLGRRPSVDTEWPEVRINLHLTDSRMRLYVDFSGESLHRRGYRRVATAAPLRENTAAAVLARAGWDSALSAWRRGEGPQPFLSDPMCGSGTIAIEAARQALDMAPGAERAEFGFERLRGYDEAVWRRLRHEAAERLERGRAAWTAEGGRIWASDVDPEAVEATKANAEAAGVPDILTIEKADFARLRHGAILGELSKSFDPENAAGCFIVTNPPYGHRLGGKEARAHERLGRWLAERFTGFRAAVLADSKEQARELGLRADRLYSVYNGNLNVVLAVVSLDQSNRFHAAGDRGTTGGVAAASRRATGDSPRSTRVASATSTDATRGVESIMNRLRKNRRVLKRVLEREAVSCYRIYDADIPQYAAAVDVYVDREEVTRAVVQEYAPPATVEEAAAAARFAELIQAVQFFLEIGPEAVFTRERRRQRGTAQYRPRSTGGSVTAVVEEDGLLFEVNFTDYLDVGLFLDHRLVRRRIRERAEGVRFLNLFAYTCAATVHAAAGGASRTVSVDTSNTYLEWGTRNLGLNGIVGPAHEIVRSDSLTFLRRGRDTYDLMLIDPPSFSNSKSRDADLDVQRDHVELCRAALSRLAPGGSIFFSANLRSFSLSDEVREIAEVTDLSEGTLPPNFARSARRRHVYLLTKAGRR